MHPREAELIARCPVHGHPPYNDPQWHESQEPKQEDRRFLAWWWAFLLVVLVVFVAVGLIVLR